MRDMIVATLLLSLFYHTLVSGQAPVNGYWQQEVNYTINVTLNDKTHFLYGDINMAYTNNSPNELSEIYIHLWPNAYKNQSTAFAKQKLESGSTRFYKSIASERGYIDSLNFMVNNKAVALVYDEQHPDIAKIILTEALTSGSTINISTPFRVKIPDSFSRLGHVGQSYQLTQWYPKPAVYDSKGWHAMPYLDQGEFYSEYGNFDVSITLADNYVVGATGVLQNQEELSWLNEKAEATTQIEEFEDDNSFPESSKKLKTLRYVQNNVHDFAWFADKRFHVLKGEVQLPNSERSVTTWAMFTNRQAEMWKSAIEYLNDGIYFYSDKVGNYPYQHCTAVQSALSAGAGMEYPMITVIGLAGSDRSLERVIVHEVGHNWFYGILGSNERTDAWMDEGINSYYENRYFYEKYPNTPMLGDFANTGLAKFLDVHDLQQDQAPYYAHLLAARNNSDQPACLHAHEFTDANYGLIVYVKMSQSMRLLEQYLGTRRFDTIMKKYYQQFEFKHPQYEDFKSLMENETGKYLDWFFDGLIDSKKKVDYSLVQVQKNVENIGKDTYDKIFVYQGFKNKVDAPFSISAIKNDSIVKTVWYDGFLGGSDVLFPSLDYDKLVLDANFYTPDINRHNNHIKAKGLAKKIEKLRLQPFGSITRDDKSQIFFSPTYGFNTTDGSMLGLAFYNALGFNKKVEFTFAPMYGFRSGNITGFANFNYHLRLNEGKIKQVTFGAGVRTFGERLFQSFERQTGGEPGEILPNLLLNEEVINYYRFNPNVTIYFREASARSKKSTKLHFQHIYLLKDLPTCNADPALDQFCNLTSDNVVNHYVNELSLQYANRRRINPLQLNVGVQQGFNFVLPAIEAAYILSYGNKKRSGLKARLYGANLINLNSGQDPANILPPRLQLTYNPGLDYTYENLYIDRANESGNFHARQINMQQAAFKVPVAFNTDQYMLALNLKANLPINALSFVQLYSDFAVMDYFAFDSQDNIIIDDDGNIVTEATLFFDAGIALTPLQDLVEVYFPLLHSQNIRNALDASDRSKFFQKITFYINFPQANPLKLARNLNL